MKFCLLYNCQNTDSQSFLFLISSSYVSFLMHVVITADTWYSLGNLNKLAQNPQLEVKHDGSFYEDSIVLRLDLPGTVLPRNVLITSPQS